MPFYAPDRVRVIIRIFEQIFFFPPKRSLRERRTKNVRDPFERREIIFCSPDREFFERESNPKIRHRFDREVFS